MTFNCAECGRTQSEPLDLDKTGNAVCWNCGRSPYSDLPPTPSDRVTDPRTAPPARGFLSRFFRRGDPGAPPDGTAPEAPPPDPAPAPASSSQSSAAAPFEKQPEFTVSLTKIGADKIEVIKLVRDVTSLGLREAKNLVEGAPKAVKKGVTKDEAAAIKKKFEEVGATVSIADASGTLADVTPSLTLTQPSHSAEKTGESRATAERAQASVKLTINPQFDGARSFNEGLAAVRIGDDTTGKHGFIDETGHYVINPQFPSAESFSDGLAAVCITDGFWITWGFIDKTGNYAIKPKFDSAESFSDGLARVCISDGTTRKRLPASNAKWGFIDKTGNYVINPQFDDAGSFSEGLAAVRIGDDETGKWGYIDKTGRIVINPQFDSAIEFSEGLGRVSIDEVNPNAVFDEDGDRVLDTDSPHWLEPDSMSKFGFIDRTGHSVIIPKFDRAGAFSEGLAWVSIADKYGFIDKTGHFVINPPFNFAQSFSDGLAAVRIGDDQTGKWGYIDKTGRIVINPQFDDAGSFREGLAWVSIGDDETGKYGFIDKTGHFVIIPKFRLAGSFCGGLAMVFIGDKWGYTSILEMSQ